MKVHTKFREDGQSAWQNSSGEKGACHGWSPAEVNIPNTKKLQNTCSLQQVVVSEYISRQITYKQYLHSHVGLSYYIKASRLHII